MAKKMRCPICGAGFAGDRCVYCNIVEGQVINASNKLAKENIKNKDRSEVYYSSYMPSDVDRKKLMLYTVLLGWLGIDDLYLGKRVKGLMHMVSISLLMILIVLTNIVKSTTLIVTLNGIMSFVSLFASIMIVVWAMDIFRFIFKSTKVPVVLADSEIERKNNYKRTRYHKTK